MLLAFYTYDGVLFAPHEVLAEVLRYLYSPNIRKKGVYVKQNGSKDCWPTPPTPAKRTLYSLSTTSQSQSQPSTTTLPYSFSNDRDVAYLMYHSEVQSTRNRP